MLGYGFGVGDWMFRIAPIIITACFVVVFMAMIVMAVSGIRTWNKNNHSPRLDVAAVVVTKRTSTSRHHHSDTHHTTASTSYYATFQFDSGDRLELSVSGPEYGMLAEGDRGTLTFQGTRFLGFQRS